MFEDIFETVAIVRQSLKPLRASRWKMTKLLVYHCFRQLSTIQLVLLISVTALLTYAIFSVVRDSTQKRDDTYLGLPKIGDNRDHQLNFPQLVEEAAAKYPGSPYVVSSPSINWVIFPSQMWDEVKRLPSDIASLREAHNSVFYGQHTGLGRHSEAMLKAVANEFIRCQPSRVHQRQKATKRGLLRFIGRCDNWTPVQILPVSLDMIANVNACSIVGDELGNNANWIAVSKRYPMTMMIAIFFLNILPTWLRTVLAPVAFLANLKVQWDIEKMLLPQLREDVRKYDEALDKRELAKVKVGERLPLTTWILNHAKERPTEKELIRDYILLGLESTTTQCSALFSALMNLAADSKLVDELREEIEENSEDGKLPLTHLSELKLLDSFLCESFRLGPLALVNLQRRLQKPVQLSAGPTLPAGTMICVDVHNIYNDQNRWKNAQQFDPKRFQKLRDVAGDESTYNFAASSSYTPGFGGGNQACPGRLYASSSLKITLSAIIMNYDLKLVAGAGKPRPLVMPNGSYAPDFNAKVLFRSRPIPW